MNKISLTGSLVTRKLESTFAKVYEAPDIKELTIDLSRIDWVELDAVHRLVVIVEWLKGLKVNIQIAMPLLSHTCFEKQKLTNKTGDPEAERLQGAPERRKKAAEYLLYLRFLEVVACDHIKVGKVDIFWNWDLTAPASDQRKDKDAPDIVKVPDSYGRIYPLRWLRYDPKTGNQNDVERATNWMMEVLNKQETRLSRDDAKALIRIALHEFLENVSVHAEHPTSHGLYTIWVRQTRTFRIQNPKNQLKDSKAERTTVIQPEESNNQRKPYDDFEQKFIDEWQHDPRPARELIEMHFGDSGRGIVSSLKDAFLKDKQASQSIPKKRLTEDQKVLFYALNRWSSSVDSSHKRGTRGLYRMRRLAMGYEGMISVTCGHDKVFYAYPDGQSVSAQRHSKSSSICPGTSLTLRMVVPEKQSDASYAPEPNTTFPNPPKFLFEPLHVSSAGGVTESQKTRLQYLLNHEYSSQDNKVFVGFLQNLPNPSQPKKAIEQILYDTALITHPNACVLMIPAIPSRELKEYIHAVNQDIDRKRQHEDYSPHIYDPIMVVDRDLNIHWVGATQAFREMLRSLVQFKEWVPLSSFPEYQTEIRQQRWLFVFDGPLFCLRFTGETLQRKLGEVIEARILHALEHEDKVQPGLTRGNYITPSLWNSRMWLEVKTFFPNLCWYDNQHGLQTTSRIAAEASINEAKRERRSELRKQIHPELPIELLVFRLISKLRAELRFKNEDAIKYMVCESTDSAAVLAFEQYLNVEPIVISRIDSPGLYENVWGYLQDRSVIVFADIIFTANSAKKILHELQKAGARPYAVVCFLDDRKPKEQGQQIDTYHIPVISLAQAADHFSHEDGFEIADEANFTHIEPQTYTFNHNPKKDLRSQAETAELDLSHAITESRCLILNHIHRPGSRHFNFYMNIEILIQSKQGTIIIDNMRDTLLQWMQSFEQSDSKKQKLFFYYPEVAGSSWAEKIATGLKKSLENYNAEILLRPVLRPENRSQFIYHTEDSLHGSLAVIVDWGIVTGDTITRIIRHLAENKAEAILCLVALSSMSTYEEQLLMSMAEIYRDQTQDTKVSVKWKTLSRFPIKAYQGYDCPVCRMQNEYQSLKASIATPEVIQFIDEFTKQLEPQTRNRFFKIRYNDDRQRDNFATPLSAAQIYRMAFLLEDIENASFSTPKRLQLYHDWKALYEKASKEADEKDEGPFESCALILCALANTKSKLEENAFLRLEKVRRQLAAMAVLVLHGPLSSFHPHALMMLSACSAKVFSEELVWLLKRFRTNSSMLLRILLELHLTLERQVVPRPEVVDPIEKAIDDKLNEIYDRANQGEFTYPDFMKHALKELRIKNLRRKTHIASTQNLNQAVKKIKDTFQDYIKPHKAIPTLAKVLWEVYYETQAEYEAIESPNVRFEGPTHWQKKLDHWYIVLEFLERELIPPAMVIYRLLASEYFRGSVFNDEDILELNKVLQSAKANSLTRFTQLLQTFAVKPPQVRSSSWSQFIVDREWIFDTFLKYKTGQQSAAKLFQVVEEIPCDLTATLEAVHRQWADQANITINSTAASSYVFCHSTLVQSILNDILENAIKTHRIPTESSCVSMIQDVKQDILKLTIQNTGSHPDTHNASSNKQGLESAKRHLQTFSGAMDWHFDSRMKQFTVIIEFRLWRPS